MKTSSSPSAGAAPGFSYSRAHFEHLVDLALGHFAEARVERDLAGRDRALVARSPLR